MLSSEELRILHVIPSLIKGGAERLCLDIAIAIAQIPNVKVKVAVMEDQVSYTELAAQAEICFVHSQITPSVKGKWKVKTEGYDQLVADFKPHVIHSHLFMAELLTQYKPLSGVHYVSHLHDNMFQFRKMEGKDWLNKKRITEWYEKQFLIKQYKKSEHSFIAISNHTSAFFHAVFPAKLSRKIILLHNAINFKKFERKEPAQLQDKPLKFVMTGSMVNKKNQIFLVDVMKHLVKFFPDAQLDLLGDGPNRKLIQNKVMKEGLEKNIFLHGNVADVVPFLHQSHFYLHAATYEPFGLVLLEAMAASLVCVSLNGGGNLDIHEEGKNGFVIDPPDAEKFAAMLVDLAQDQAKYEQIAHYARNYAARFDIHSYIIKLIEIYKSRLHT